jgi:hypothetical protein
VTLPQTPAIQIVKTATLDGQTPIVGSINAGATVIYVYEITNTGDVTLTNVTAVDDNGTPGDASDDVPLEGCATTLAPNTSTTCTYERPTSVADGPVLTNVVVASGTSPRGEIVTDQDEESITVLPVLAEVDVPVFKLNCASDPGDVSVDDILSDELPGGCELVGGVEFDATANGIDIEDPNEPFITGDDGGFVITVESGEDLVITEDETTATAGYAPRENPVTLDDVAEGDGVVFVNLATSGEFELTKAGASATGSAVSTSRSTAMRSTIRSTPRLTKTVKSTWIWRRVNTRSSKTKRAPA